MKTKTKPGQAALTFEHRVNFPSPGIYNDITEAEYHALGADARRGSREFILSRSELWRFVEQGAHKWVEGEGEVEATKAMDFGSVVDTLIMRPEEFSTLFVERPETYTTWERRGRGETQTPIVKPWNANSHTCQEWLESQKRTVLTRTEIENAKRCAKKLMQYLPIKKLIEHSAYQIVVIHQLPLAGGHPVRIKAMIDIVPVSGDHVDALADIKTTASIAPHDWRKKLASFGYYFQAGFYLDTFNGATGQSRTKFLHPIVENTPPFEPAARQLHQFAIAHGQEKSRAALGDYLQCVQTGDWPEFDDVIREKTGEEFVTYDLPIWGYKDQTAE